MCEQADNSKIFPVAGKMALKHEFIRLRAQGVSLKQAAEQLHLGIGTLCEWGKALELEIASARAIELEALLAEFYLLKEHRIKAFGQLLKRIDDALELRDFAELDTGKLIEYRLKILQDLANEMPVITPVVAPSIGTKPV